MLSLNLSPTQWTPIGPAPTQTPGVAQGFSAGRIEVAAPDPTNPFVMYIGGANGGVWKTSTWHIPSSEGGPTWLPLSDHMPSLDFAGYHSLVVHPANNKLILGVVSGTGGGVLKSVNAGFGWQLLGNNKFEGASLGSIAVHPTDTQIMYVSVRGGGTGGGVYKTSDGGATWQNTTAGVHTGGVSDVVLDPSHPDVLYAGMIGNGNGGATTAGIYKSSDGGVTWKWLDNAGPPSGIFVGAAIRLEVANTSPSPNFVYATVFNADINGTETVRRYQSTTGGQSWRVLAPTPGIPELRSWHVVLAVDPFNPNHIYVNDAYELFESMDGGTKWTKAEQIGDDWVNLSFDAIHEVVATGDRDIHSYNPAAQTWDAREGNLQITEFYDITLDPNNLDRAYGVAQDHFDAMKFQGDLLWHYTAGGGGETGKVLVHPNNSNLLYVSDPLDPAQLVRRSTNGGQSWTTILNTNTIDDEDYVLAYAAQKSFVMDPTNPKRLLIGTREVLETTNADAANPTWQGSGVLAVSANPDEQAITALALSADGQSIYAATADGHVWIKHAMKFWTADRRHPVRPRQRDRLRHRPQRRQARLRGDQRPRRP